MRFQGRLKAITFKGERVSVLLEDARIFKEAQQVWEDYTDLKLVKTGKYAKGEVWMSSFKEPVYQACEELKKMGTGIEVEVGVVENKGFLNIAGIGLKVKEVDVNADLQPPDDHEIMWGQDGMGSGPTGKSEPSSDQRPKDSPEAQAERLTEKEIEELAQNAREAEKSTTLDMTDKDISIIRQTCVKAVGAIMNLSPEDLRAYEKLPDKIVAIAKRLETFVLTGK